MSKNVSTMTLKEREEQVTKLLNALEEVVTKEIRESLTKEELEQRSILINDTIQTYKDYFDVVLARFSKMEVPLFLFILKMYEGVFSKRYPTAEGISNALLDLFDIVSVEVPER